MDYSKKALLLLVMLFLIVSISAVSAQDLNQNSTVDLINDDDLISIGNNDIADSISDSSALSTGYDEEVLEASPDTVVPTFPEIDSGVVSGGVDLPSVNPGRSTSGSLEYTIPSNSVNIKSAYVIVNIYSGSGSNLFGLYSNVTLNSNKGIEVLGYETLTTGIESMVNDPNVYYISEHATKQYSDYQLLYPITDKVNNLNPGDTFTIGVANKKIDGYNFEGFIKTITLFVAYDDGDDDEISYWLDVGQLWTQTTETYSFSTSSYSGKKDNITLRQISLTSSDATYLVNNNELVPSSIVSGDYYYKFITFDNIDTVFNSASNTDVLIQQPHGGVYGSYKTNIALLVASDIKGTSNSIFVDYGSGSDNNDGSSWADAFKTIDHALSIASEGATIYIASGVNRLDGVGAEGLTIDKNISIVGIGSDVIIDAAGAGRIFNIDGLTVSLNNLIFANADVSDASLTRGGALYVSNSILNIDNCQFINNTAGTSNSYSGAINLKASNATITNSYFENNTAWYGGSAIYSESGNIFVNIQNSQFINNRALNTGYAMGGALMLYGDSIINRAVLLNNSLGDKSRANSGQAINYGQGNHILVNSIILGEGLLKVNLGSNAVVSLEDNWWGNANIDKDANPKDLGYTNGNVESYLVLSSGLSQENVYLGDVLTITTTLNKNVIELPVEIDADLGTVTPVDATMTSSLLATYTATTLGEEVVTIDVLGIKNEIGFTVKEALPDVAITNVKTPWSDGIYPAVNNTFTITLNNAEDGNVEGLVLEVYSNETGALIASYPIESLVSGTSTIYVTDPTIRPITEDTVWPAARNNKIKFTFSLMKGTDLVTTLSVDKILAYDGYLNKTYAYGGHDNIINRNYTINGDIIIATQDVSVYMDQFSRFRNETWNIETPEDAEIVKVLLYFNYNWDTSFFPNGWTLEFNGFDITSDYLTHEMDRGNLGGWGAYNYGLLTFDVTEYYLANQNNSFTITKTGNCALYPSTLYVLYNVTDSYVTKDVYFTDICDVFYPYYNMNGYDDLTRFTVDFNGLNLENIDEATWYVFSGSTSSNNNLIFNNQEFENAFVGRTSNDCYALQLDVTEYISENNRVWFISTNKSSTTVAYEQVLVISKMEEKIETSIEITSIAGNGSISGILKDNNGLGLSNQNIKLIVDNVEVGNTTTNDNGEFTITGKNGVNNIIFEGNGNILTSSKSITLIDITSKEDAEQQISDLETQLEEAQANATRLADELAEAKANLTTAEERIAELEGQLADAQQQVIDLTAQLEEAQKQIQNLTADLIPTTIVTNALKIKALNNGILQITLKDSNGTVLVNKTVLIIINGVTKQVTTDDKGIAKLSVKYSKSGTYNVVVTFMGDKKYSAAIATSKITVVKKATKITAPKKKFKVNKKIKKVKITLKSEGKALAKKKVTLKVKGKTFKAKTNSKGVAIIKVKLNKRGTFKYRVKFAGDGAYKAISKKGKLIIRR